MARDDGFGLRMRLGFLAALVGGAAWAADSPDEFFEKKIRPMLATHCHACHSSKAKTAFANLRLDSREGLLKGGDHGPAVVVGKPEASRLIQAVRYLGPQMPPSGRLADEQVAALAEWVRAGAVWPEAKGEGAASSAAAATDPKLHWAFQAVRDKPPPASTRGDWSSNPIDRFVLAKLEAKRLAPSPPADRRTLIRRLSYDITGLPPSAALIEAFQSDASPRAVETLVDSLLASPHFGERWARYWLDLARYADAGVRSVRFAYAHTYRDWVIRAFNSDLPYDQFVERQLAADHMVAAKRVPRSELAALGFLTLGVNPARRTELAEKVDDRIDVVTRTLLGLTVACARCHDHKFDPIPTRDYYSLYGVFANSDELAEPAAIEEMRSVSDIDRFYEQHLRKHRASLDGYIAERLAEQKAEFRQPESIRRYLAAAAEGREMSGAQLDALAKERNLNTYMLRRWRQYAAESGERDPVRAASAWPVEIPVADFWQIATEGDFNTMSELTWRYQEVFAEYAWRGSPARAMALADNTRLEPAHVLIRGDKNDLGEEAPRQFVEILSGAARTPFPNGSGRWDLARAITSTANSLTARVMVNRVWQHLFGEGLVRTPSDFGTRGEAPTHPELLDHLAASFVADGWSVKRLIRRIVLSEAYRQSSESREAEAAVDPENRYLWRAHRRRLDFEALRDSMLAASGALDTASGGPSFDLNSVPSVPRRGLYAFVERQKAESTLKAFDFTDPEQHTPQRFTTTVPQQALFLMNSPFVAEQARRLEQRGSGLDARERVRALYRWVLARDPSPSELAAAARHVAEPAAPAGVSRMDPWRYGYGEIDAAAKRVVSFTPFEYFAHDTWQAASMLPHPYAGNASLTATGGAPGDDAKRAVIRRWIAPVTGAVAIKGALSHKLSQYGQRFTYSNGVRGWLASSRHGVLATWTVKDQETRTDVASVNVTAGDSIDFVTDALDDYEADEFKWAPVIELGGQRWSAQDDFRGPAPEPLSAWARLAQVLLLTNEFAFVD